MNDKKKLYQGRAERMVKRWAGKRTEVNSSQSPVKINQQRSTPSPFIDQKTSQIVEPQRSIPVLDECDVLVVGGGPAGLSAALSARRAGADTILLERYGCFGGVITTVGVETLAWYRYEGTVDSEGIGVEMEKLAAKMGGTIKWPYNDSECLDADFFKIVADHLVTEAGVRPYLHSLAVEVIMAGNVIKGVIAESKSGRNAILAKRVIDCTGDADIAHLAGAPYRKTAKHEMMGVTTVFSCAGVNKDKFLEYIRENSATYADWGQTWDQATTGKEDKLPSPYFGKEFAKAKELGIMPKNIDTISGSWSALSDAGEATNLNLVHMKGVDCTDVKDLTKAEMQGRKESLYALEALKAVLPGFENAKLRNFGMTLGCRDSRKIVGRYSLTEDDVKNQARFEESIGIFPEFLDGYNVLILPTTGRYFQVPYGCLIPQAVDNLLVGGRCVAGDKVSHAAMRSMMACTVTGQGAGAAAAVSIKEGTSTAKIDITRVQEELVRQGVRIR
jgi:hypothetical protein